MNWHIPAPGHLHPDSFENRPLFRFYLVTEYLFIFALVSHLVLLALFIVHGVLPLALYNCISIAVFALSSYLTRRRFHYTAFLFGVAEVVLHSVMSVLCLGLAPGFHLFILTLGPCMFLLPFQRNFFKWLLVFCSLAGFFLLQLVFSQYSAPYSLPERFNELYATINLMVTILSLSFLSYYLSKASWTAENYISLLTQIDHLTGALNRRGMEESIRNEIHHSTLANTTIGILMCDIDDFKHLNDSYGHECGDAVLKETVERITSALRTTDRIGRWGGEEFLILLPGTDADGAGAASRKVLSAVAKQPFSVDGHRLQVSITIGVAILKRDESMQACIKRADEAMYRGKLAGKNRVSMADGKCLPSKRGSI